MKVLKLIKVVFLSYYSLNAFGQTDTFALSNLKVDYHVLKVEYDKLLEDHIVMEKVIKDYANSIEELETKDNELKAFINKQKEDIEKLKSELEQCKSKKKQ